MHSIPQFRKILLRLVATAAVALVLAACAGAGGVGDTVGELTQEDAQAFSSLAQQSVDYQMGMIESPDAFLAGIAPSGLHPAATSCVVQTGGSTDSDGDGIPDDVTYTYDCNESEHGYDASGSVRLQDTGNGYTVAFNALSFGFGSGSFGLDGTATVGWNHPTYTSGIDMTITFTSTEGSGSFTYDMDQTFTSSGTQSDPFATGTLVFQGSIDVASDGETYGITASANLSVDRACSTGASSGTAGYSDSAGNTLELVFSCDNVSATYNGSPLATAAD